MAKNVFRAPEVGTREGKIILEAPFSEEASEVEVESVEEYTGPTADDLQREAEAFKQNWDQEKTAMIQAAEEEAAKIIKEAEEQAFADVKRKTDEAAKKKHEAEEEVKTILEQAHKEAAELREETEKETTEIREKARKAGYEEGREEGYQTGRAEVERLVEQLHMIISKAIEKRNEIIDESETQLINLVILIARKVVKVISENQKNVVINNVIQALRKLKNRGEVLVRVNLDDVELTTEHIKDLMRMVENVRSLTVVEDSSVDKGGCIIESDFGEIDARISSQLKEIEDKILGMVPIRAKGEEQSS